MPTSPIPPSLDLHYLVDDYTDPWRTPGTILLLHGNAESSAASHAVQCAQATLEFIERRNPDDGG